MKGLASTLALAAALAAAPSSGRSDYASGPGTAKAMSSSAVFALDTTAFAETSGTWPWVVFALDTGDFSGGSGAWPWNTFRLDTLPDPRTAADVEFLAYGTDWNGGSTLRLLANGICILERGAGAAGVFEWNTAELASGTYTLEHVSGGVTLSAVFLVKAPEAATRTTPVPVPHSWLAGWGLAGNGDWESAALAMAANGRDKVWECYLAGLDPTDPDARLQVFIAMRGGSPVVTWKPDLNEGGTKRERAYTVEATEGLGAPWGATNEWSRFFRVKVGLPEKVSDSAP